MSSDITALSTQKKRPADIVNPVTASDYVLVAPTAFDAEGRIISVTLTRPGHGAETDCVRVDGADARAAWKLINSIFEGAR